MSFKLETNGVVYSGDNAYQHKALPNQSYREENMVSRERRYVDIISHGTHR